MLSSVNFWMCFAGLISLVAGVFILRKEISAARGLSLIHISGCLREPAMESSLIARSRIQSTDDSRFSSADRSNFVAAFDQMQTVNLDNQWPNGLSAASY